MVLKGDGGQQWGNSSGLVKNVCSIPIILFMPQLHSANSFTLQKPKTYGNSIKILFNSIVFLDIITEKTANTDENQNVQNKMGGA